MIEQKRIGLSGSSMNNKENLSGSATPMVGMMKELSRQQHEVLWLERNADQAVAEFSPVPVVRFATREIPSLPERLNLDLLMIQNWCFDPKRLAEEFHNYGTEVYFWDDNTPYAMSRLLSAVPHVDLILTHGEGAADILMDHNIPKEKIEVLHFATDSDRFRPEPDSNFETDVVFVGTNIWERSSSIKRLMFEPSKELSDLDFKLYGSGWDDWNQLSKYPVGFGGWIDNGNLHKAFSNATVTINATRKTYQRINCVPSNRIFDTMASGTVLLSDELPGIESLFNVGEDLLIASTTTDAINHIKAVQDDPIRAESISTQARESILGGHTWAHRVEQIGLAKQ